MRTRNNKNGYKIIDAVYKSEPNGIGFRELSRKTGLYQKGIYSWLQHLTIDLTFIRKDSFGRSHLSDVALEKYKANNLIIPLDSRSKKIEKQQKKEFTKVLGKNYPTILILILSLAAFVVSKPTEYKKQKLGLVVIPDPINPKRSYLYGTKNFRPGVLLSDFINKLENKSGDSPNKKAFLPKYYINYENNELFGYLKISEENAQKYIDYLSKAEILTPINYKKFDETRYEILDKLLEEFVQQCILAFNNDVNLILEYGFTHNLLSKYEYNEYLKFLKIWYGRSRKYSNIQTYITKQKTIKKDSISKEHYRKYIDICNKDIFAYGLFKKNIMKTKYDHYNLIIGEKYKLLQERYPVIINIFLIHYFHNF